MDRTLSPTSALLNLFCGMLGPGFLSVPAAFKMAGLWAGFALVFIVGGMCLFSMYRLVQCSQLLVKKSPGVRCLSYGDTVEVALRQTINKSKIPKFGRYLADFLIASFQIGVLIVSFVFAAEHLPELLEYIGVAQPTGAMPMYLMLQIVLCYSASMRLLTFLATLGNFAVLAVIVIFGKEMYSKGLHYPDSLPSITNMSGLATAAGSLIYALEGQTMILPLENRLTQRNAMLGLNGVLCTAINLVILLYAATGFFGYLCFGNSVRGSISLNLPANMSSRIVQCLLVGKVFVGTALQLHVFTDVYCPPGRGGTVGKLGGPVILVLTGLIAMFVPRLSLIIPLVGLTSGLLLSLILPPLLHILITLYLPFSSPIYRRLLSCSLDLLIIVTGLYFLFTGLYDYILKHLLSK